MTTLWMIEDLEPFPDMPQAGDVCEPTTYWTTPERLNLPSEVGCTVSARIEEVAVDGRTERIAYLGCGVSTLLPEYIEGDGDVTLAGCLVWDRYLWMDCRTIPAGKMLVNSRQYLTQRVAGRTPTQHAGWYTENREGLLDLRADLGGMPDNREVVSYALSVSLLP